MYNATVLLFHCYILLLNTNVANSTTISTGTWEQLYTPTKRCKAAGSSDSSTLRAAHAAYVYNAIFKVRQTFTTLVMRSACTHEHVRAVHAKCAGRGVHSCTVIATAVQCSTACYLRCKECGAIQLPTTTATSVCCGCYC